MEGTTNRQQSIFFDLNESDLMKSGLLEEYYYMSNFKMVAPYCGVSRYDKIFFVYYLNTDENLRREYEFNTETDANNFNKTLENLTVCMKGIPLRKKEVYHQALLDLLLKEVDHKLSVRTNPDGSAAAASAIPSALLSAIEQRLS